MLRLRRCFWFSPQTMLICLAALAASPLTARAQRDDSQRPATKVGAKPSPIALSGVAADLKGSKSCGRGCHNMALPMEGVNPPEDLRDFCLRNENLVFFGEDRHSQAYDVLESGLGKQMADRLGYDVTKAEGCLSCHYGGHPARNDGDERPWVSEGVGCEACHGPSRRWVEPHQETDWRKTSPESKSEKGMIDVRDPLVRAELCFSCHIGNVELGRVVTHQMYAAGHPPLPGIELETFLSAMPYHWRSFREKGDFKFRSEYAAVNHEAALQEKGSLPRTKDVLIGSLVALRDSLHMFAAQTEKDGPPEFAMYDCQACHHDLRSPAWRQRRAAAGRPGRPRLPAWPVALVRVAVRALEEDPAAAQREVDLLNEKLRQVNAALDSQPFGNRAEIAAAVGSSESGLIQWLDQKAQRLAQAVVDVTMAERVLAELQKLSRAEPYDLNSTRQVAFALRCVLVEVKGPKYPEFATLKEKSASLKRDQVNKDVLQFLAWRNSVGEFTQALGPLDRRLALNLPAGKKKSISDLLPDRENDDPNKAEKHRKLLELQIKLLQEQFKLAVDVEEAADRRPGIAGTLRSGALRLPPDRR